MNVQFKLHSREKCENTYNIMHIKIHYNCSHVIQKSIWTQTLLFSVPCIISHFAHTRGSKSLSQLQQMCASLCKPPLLQMAATVSPQSHQLSQFRKKNIGVCLNQSGRKSLYTTHEQKSEIALLL